MTWKIEFDEDIKIVFVENDVKGIRKAILMYSPSNREWADKLAPKYSSEGWEVEMLNGGIEEEYGRIQEIVEILDKLLEVLL